MVDVFADDGNGHFINRVFRGIDCGGPFGQIGRFRHLFKTQFFDHDLVEFLFVQPERQLVDIINVDATDNGAFVHVGKKSDFLAFAFWQRSFATAQQNVRLNTNRA